MRKIIFALCCLLCSFASFAQSKESKDLSDTYFKTGKIIDINISIDDKDLNFIMENPLVKKESPAAITINDVVITNVGLQTKGRSTLLLNAKVGVEKLPLKIDFTAFKKKSYQGITALNLNNEYLDPVFMREYISYEVFKKMNVPVPAKAYSNVLINGKPFGFYLAVEEIGQSFCQRYYGSYNGELFKPNGKGANLEWLGYDKSAYKALNSRNKTAKGFKSYIKMVRAVNFATSTQEIEEALNVDEWLRYLAVNAALVNYDSFLAENPHNYFLYEKNGRFEILPYDLNMSFGGKPMKNYVDMPVYNMYIDDPTDGITGTKPVLVKLFSFPEYVERYHNYLQIIADNVLVESWLAATIDNLETLIRPSMQADPNQLYDDKSFDADVQNLKEFAAARRQSIISQLKGTVPSKGPLAFNGSGGQELVDSGDWGAAPARGKTDYIFLLAAVVLVILFCIFLMRKK